jgi:hypothetical protein
MAVRKWRTIALSKSRIVWCSGKNESEILHCDIQKYCKEFSEVLFWKFGDSVKTCLWNIEALSTPLQTPRTSEKGQTHRKIPSWPKTSRVKRLYGELEPMQKYGPASSVASRMNFMDSRHGTVTLLAAQMCLHRFHCPSSGSNSTQIPEFLETADNIGGVTTLTDELAKIDRCQNWLERELSAFAFTRSH